jgi:hypothetical protein
MTGEKDLEKMDCQELEPRLMPFEVLHCNDLKVT